MRKFYRVETIGMIPEGDGKLFVPNVIEKITPSDDKKGIKGYRNCINFPMIAEEKDGEYYDLVTNTKINFTYKSDDEITALTKEEISASEVFDYISELTKEDKLRYYSQVVLIRSVCSRIYKKSNDREDTQEKKEVCEKMKNVLSEKFLDDFKLETREVLSIYDGVKKLGS